MSAICLLPYASDMPPLETAPFPPFRPLEYIACDVIRSLRRILVRQPSIRATCRYARYYGYFRRVSATAATLRFFLQRHAVRRRDIGYTMRYESARHDVARVFICALRSAARYCFFRCRCRCRADAQTTRRDNANIRADAADVDCRRQMMPADDISRRAADTLTRLSQHTLCASPSRPEDL